MSTNKLSKLQKEILKLALKGKRYRLAHPKVQFTKTSKDVAEQSHVVDVTYAEIKCAIFRLPLSHPGISNPWENPYHSEVDMATGSQCFSKKEIGERRYNSIDASLSKSIRRLEERGLVEYHRGAYCNWHGIDLTNAGVLVAEEISRNG